jgi:hypothetical protein
MASTGSNFEAVIADKNTINQLRQLIQYLKEYITHSRTNSKSKP